MLQLTTALNPLQKVKMHQLRLSLYLSKRTVHWCMVMPTANNELHFRNIYISPMNSIAWSRSKTLPANSPDATLIRHLLATAGIATSTYEWFLMSHQVINCFAHPMHKCNTNKVACGCPNADNSWLRSLSAWNTFWCLGASDKAYFSQLMLPYINNVRRVLFDSCVFHLNKLARLVVWQWQLSFRVYFYL